MLPANVQYLKQLVDNLNDGQRFSSGKRILCTKFNAQKDQVEIYHGQFKKEHAKAKAINPTLTQDETWTLIPTTREAIFTGDIDDAIIILERLEHYRTPLLYREITQAAE